MRYRPIGLMTLVLALSLAAASRADLRPPQADPVDPETATVYSFSVKIDPQARVALLQVPDSATGPAGAAPEPPRLPSDDQSSVSPGRIRTMVAGLAISLALASLVLVRRSTRSKQILVGLIVATVSLGAIGIAWGDIPGPGPRPRPPFRPPVRPNPDAQIQIEFVPGAENVTLIVPKGLLERLAKTAGTLENRPGGRGGER